MSPCFKVHGKQLPETRGEHRGRGDLASGDRVGGGRGSRVLSGLRGPAGVERAQTVKATTTFPPGLPCLFALRSGANVAAAFRVLAGPTRIRRRQQPGLWGLRGAADPGRAPAGLRVNAEGVGTRSAVPLGTISPPVSAFFPSQHPCVWAPGSESQGLSCGLRCRGRPPDSSRPR